MQLLAHVLGLPVVRYRGSEHRPGLRRGTARADGAHRLKPASEVCAKPAVLDVLEPDPALHATPMASDSKVPRALSGPEAGVPPLERRLTSSP